MKTLREAAQAVVNRWDAPLWKDGPATAVLIAALRTALEAPEQDSDAYSKVLKAKCGAFFANTQLALDELAAMTAERDALAADAARYHWMTAQIVSGNLEKLEQAFAGIDPYAESITKDEFDAVIDAGIKETP